MHGGDTKYIQKPTDRRRADDADTLINIFPTQPDTIGVGDNG